MANRKTVSPNTKVIPMKRHSGRQRPSVIDSKGYAIRIREFRKQKGFTQPELAEAVGVTKNAVSNWEAGRTRPDLDTIKQLCNALNISSDTLLGIQNNHESYSESEIKLIETMRCLMPHDRRMILTLINAMHEEQYKDFCEHYHSNFAERQIDELSACAGTGIDLDGGGAEPERIILRLTPEVRQCDEIIRIVGDSMQPTYRSGDKVLVEYTEEIYPGEIGIFVFNGEGMIKEYQADGLHAHNPQYETIRPCAEDVLRCVGRVISRLEQSMLPSPEEQIMIDEMLCERAH